MADDVLKPGTTIKYTTCYDEEIIGEVAAWAYQRQAVIIVSKPTDDIKLPHNNVHLLNLTKAKALEVIKEPPNGQDAPPLTAIDNQKLTRRLKDRVQEKMSLVRNIGIGVSPEAQSLYNSIHKTVEDLKWDGKTIVAMSNVYIREPYTINDITTSGKIEGKEHVAKIVAKFYEDKQKFSGS